MSERRSFSTGWQTAKAVDVSKDILHGQETAFRKEAI